MKARAFFRIMPLLALVGMLALTACRAEPVPPPPVPVPEPLPVPADGELVTITISASNTAFDKGAITVPAGARVTMSFTNNETFAFHNFAIYETSAAAQVIFKGDFVNAGKTGNYTFTAPSRPGTYFFRCDVHPTLMTGDFIVTEGDGG